MFEQLPIILIFSQKRHEVLLEAAEILMLELPNNIDDALGEYVDVRVNCSLKPAIVVFPEESVGDLH